MSDRLTVNAGVRYTLNFPSIEENNQAAVFNLDRSSSNTSGATETAVRPAQLHKLNFGPRLGIVDRLTDKMVGAIGIWARLDREAGITTPFTTPVFPFLQTVSQRTLDNITPAFALAAGPTVAPIPLTPDAGLGQGVFSVDRDLGSGYVQQWNASFQRQLRPNVSVEAAYVGSKITRVGIPDTNLNQLTVEQLAIGSPLLTARDESLLRDHPALVVTRRPDDPGCAADEAVPGVHDGQPVPQQRRNDDLPGLRAEARTAVLARALVSRELHALEAPGRRVVGVRCVDPDGTGGELPGRPTASTASWSATIRPATSRTCSSPPRSGSCPSGQGRRIQPTGVVGAIVNDWSLSGIADAAVGRADRRDAGDQQQRLRWIRHAASEPGRRSDAAR